jgi:hypothetical protein
MEIKNREKVLAIGLGAVIAFWLIDIVVLKPMMRSWSERSDQIVRLSRQLSDGRQLLTRGSEVLDRWSKMQTNALSFSATLAESQLFNAFDGWVRDSSVIQGAFHPQLRETEDNYNVLECRADVSGSMEQIFNFLYDLEKDPIAIKLDSVGLTSRDDTGRQLTLVLEMSGLMMPAMDPFPPLAGAAPETATAATNTPDGLDKNTLELIVRNNIFDPNRVGLRNNRREPRAEYFTFCGGAFDGPGAVAFFSGEGASNKPMKPGDKINGFKVGDITFKSVKLQPASGPELTLVMGGSMRREPKGPWKLSEQPEPAPESSEASASSDTAAPAAPSSANDNDLIKRLKARRDDD